MSGTRTGPGERMVTGPHDVRAGEHLKDSGVLYESQVAGMISKGVFLVSLLLSFLLGS